MKLLFCRECNDLFNLQSQPKYCSCKRVGGCYVNGREAIFVERKENDAVLLGIHNDEFGVAVTHALTPRITMGTLFKSWIINRPCATFKKVHSLDSK